MGTGYVRNDTSNNIADGNIINAADLDGEFDAIESAMGTSGHTHDGTAAEGGPITVLGPVQDFVASATEIKPKTTNTLDIGTSGLLFKDMFLDGVATVGSIKIDNAGTIGSATTGDAITISSGGIVTFKDDIIVKDGGTIGVTSAVDAMTVSSAGIVTFKDDIIIKDGGAIGSASDGDAIAISSGGVVSFSQNTIGKTASGHVLALQTSDTTIEATNVLGKIEFSAPDEASGTDAILVGASIEALAEATFDSATNSTALVFKTNTTGAATERMRLTSAGDLHFLDDRKAIFGAGSDLEIYHNGTHNIIQSNEGNITIETTSDDKDIFLKSDDGAGGSATYLQVDGSTGSINLRNYGDIKLATTSTGVDVTGTLTSDGLTVDGDARFTGTLSTLNYPSSLLLDYFSTVTGTRMFSIGPDASTEGQFEFHTATTSANKKRLSIASGGDISFYEDTGTTAKFFWDASAESLGIGTTSPDAALNIGFSGADQANSLRIEGSNGSSERYALDIEADGENAKTNFKTASGGAAPTTRMTIDNIGNVGIGTDSPAQTLHLKSANPVIRLEDSSPDGVYAQIDGAGGGLILSADGGAGSASSFIGFRVDGTALSNEAMRIDSSGNVLIGGSTIVGPSSGTAQKLELQGTGATETGYFVNHTASYSYSGIYNASDSNTYNFWKSGNNYLFGTVTDPSTAGWSEAMRIDSSGNVGIGQSPTNRFDVTSSAIVVSKFKSSAGGSGARAVHSLSGNGNSVDGLVFISCGSTSTVEGGANAATIRNSENAPLIFGTNNTERMRINSSGNVLFGCVSFPSASVAGFAVTGTSSGNASSSGASTAAYNHLLFYNGNGLVGYVSTSGSSTTYSTSSDYRLKENVVDLTGATDRIKQIPVHRFNFIADPDTTVDGFLAHEVQDIVPEAITGTKDAMRDEEYEVTPAVLDDDGNVVTEAVMGTRSVPDYQGIDQSKLVPLLTAALQEALTKIDALETRITALEG